MNNCIPNTLDNLDEIKQFLERHKLNILEVAEIPK